jgi:hypothetical protein
VYPLRSACGEKADELREEVGIILWPIVLGKCGEGEGLGSVVSTDEVSGT